jgi:hypothetical protein
VAFFFVAFFFAAFFFFFAGIDFSLSSGGPFLVENERYASPSAMNGMIIRPCRATATSHVRRFRTIG